MVHGVLGGILVWHFVVYFGMHLTFSSFRTRPTFPNTGGHSNTGTTRGFQKPVPKPSPTAWPVARCTTWGETSQFRTVFPSLRKGRLQSLPTASDNTWHLRESSPLPLVCSWFVIVFRLISTEVFRGGENGLYFDYIIETNNRSFHNIVLTHGLTFQLR